MLEPSQVLHEKWLTANCDERLRILEIVHLNVSVVDVTLVPTIRKSFDVLAEGLPFERSCHFAGELRPGFCGLVSASVGWLDGVAKLLA